MKLNSKVTWGLAWAGLAVVVAVPSADFLTGKMGMGGTAAVVTSTTDPVTPATSVAPALSPAPVKTAAVTTKVTKNGVTIIPAGSDPNAAPSKDPVDKFLKAGKPLPDYISGGDDADTAKANTPSSEPTTQVASLPASPAVAPVPFPSTARPPATPKRVVPSDPTVIVDDPADQQAAIDSPDVTPVPPAGIEDDSVYIDSKRARLDRYLQQNGLLGDSSPRSTATVTVEDAPADNYDPNGFYLSDGPNNSRLDRARRRARIERMFADQNDNSDSWFSLF